MGAGVLMDIDQANIRTLKVKAETHANIINSIVDNLVIKYNQELTTLITEVRNVLHSGREVSDQELEMWTLRLPTYMYFTGTGLEKLGTESDAAKAIKMEAYNEVINAIEGTIPEKRGRAENATYNEHLIEVAFARAYKRLQRNMVDAEHMFSSLKKIITVRQEEKFMSRRDD